MKRLAITGLGIVSPQGVGRPAFMGALRDPEAARRRAFGRTPTVFEGATVPQGRVAEVWDFDPAEWLGPKGHRNFDRLTKFLIVAAKHALQDAGLERDGERVGVPGERIGVCAATAYGSLDAITELNRVAELEDPRYINPTRFPNTVINSSAGYVSIWAGLRAPNTTIVDGNCGALDAVLSAETHLGHGRGDVFLVGGGEVLSEPLLLAFRRLGALADSDGPGEQSGLHLGEGATFACAEELEAARARGAQVLATFDGYGTAFEPPESEARLVHASPKAVRRAVAGALEDAGVAPGEVDVVCAAASGLGDLDDAEREGLRAVLGDEVAIAAPKRVDGETFGAAGAFGVAHALAWMDGAPVGPLLAGDPPGEVRTVLVHALGYYGNSSAVVVRSA
ncbi:MAG: beta-ketoacyl synthase N-terminal-like domain-containing protein [Myxococcota bacterium]